MSSTIYKSMVLEHQDLNRLINQKEINVFSNFRAFKGADSEFITWLSPQYYDSFIAIFDECIGKEEGKIVRLMSTLHLCDAETLDRIALYFEPYLEDALDSARHLLTVIQEPESDFIVQAQKTDEHLTHVMVNIFNHFKQPVIREKRKAIILIYLDICDHLKRFNPKRHYFHFAMYNAIVNHLKDIKFTGTVRERLDTHIRRLSRKHSKYALLYYAGIALVILLFIIRAMRFMG